MTKALAGQFAGRAAPDSAAEATQLPATPAVLASVAESVRQAIAQAGAGTGAAVDTLNAGADDALSPAAAAAGEESTDSILDALDQQTDSAELGGGAPRPALHFRNNDVELSAASRPSGGNGATTGVYLEMVGTKQACAALIHGNRIETPATDVTAANISLYRAQAVITANLFTQLPGDTPQAVPCLTSSIFGGGAFEVMGNVISPRATIAPPRAPLPTNDWPFLNTIG
jgi:hypothetical protein